MERSGKPRICFPSSGTAPWVDVSFERTLAASLLDVVRRERATLERMAVFLDPRARRWERG